MISHHKVLEIDARILKLRLEIENAGDNITHEAAAAQSIIDKLVEKRSTLLAEIEKQTIDATLSRNDPKLQQ